MKRSLSRLPISRARASSTSRASTSTQPTTPIFRRSKSSLSLRTPQSVQSTRSKIRTKKKDARPIQDKKWQANALERTQRYFQQSAEGREYLNKGVSIRPITLKMFVQLTNVVLKNIDSSLDELTMSNYTELLPIHLDNLMYPGIVTASTLKTANTMHSWPHILAILAWLVELHEISTMVDVEEVILGIPPNAPLEVQIEKSQIKIIFDLFQQFNNGKETDEKQIELMIENMYKNLCNYSKEDFEDSSKLINKLENEVQDSAKILDNDQATLSALEDDCNNAENKLKQLFESIETEKQKKKKISARKAEHMSKTEDLKRKVTNIENSIENIKEKIKCQPMSLTQLENEEKEVEDLKREITLIKEKKAFHLNLRKEVDKKISEVKKEIEHDVYNYNLELMRPYLRHPEINQINLPCDILLQPNIKEILQENTEKKQKLLNDLNNKIRADHDTLESLKLTKENKQQDIEKIKQKIEDEKNKQEILAQKYESIKKTQEQALKQKEMEVNKLKQELMKLKEHNPNIEIKLKKLKETKIKCDELKENLYSKSADMEKFFEKLEDEICTKQIPRYEKIRKTLIEKVDKAVAVYSSPPGKK